MPRAWISNQAWERLRKSIETGAGFAMMGGRQSFGPGGYANSPVAVVLPVSIHPGDQQIQRPYTLGQTEVVPVITRAFTARDVLTVVFQVCNYGAPDADLTAEYNFFQTVNGVRRLFNRTQPQHVTDDDLPRPSPWETQAFISQAVPLQSFPPGSFELEVTVRDRLTRSVATESVAFSVR